MPTKVVNSELIGINDMTKSVSSDWRLDQSRIRDFRFDNQGMSTVHVPFNAYYG